MASTTPTASAMPIRLLTVGRRRHIAVNVGSALPSHIIFPAVIDADHFSLSALELVASSLNPPADGVFVGSGMPPEVVKEAQAWVEEWNEKARSESGKEEGSEARRELKFVTLETGALGKHGWEKTIEMLTEEIERVFGKHGEK